MKQISDIPEGYMEINPDEAKEGDLAYNAISKEWSEIPEFVLVIAKCFSGDVFRSKIVRKKEEKNG